MFFSMVVHELGSGLDYGADYQPEGPEISLPTKRTERKEKEREEKTHCTG